MNIQENARHVQERDLMTKILQEHNLWPEFLRELAHLRHRESKAAQVDLSKEAIKDAWPEDKE